jgi:hypothetical protein
MSRQTFTAMRNSQPKKSSRSSKRRRWRKTRRNVSCVASFTSSASPRMRHARRATRRSDASMISSKARSSPSRAARMTARSAGAVADVRVSGSRSLVVSESRGTTVSKFNSASAVIVRAFSNKLYSRGAEIVYWTQIAAARSRGVHHRETAQPRHPATASRSIPPARPRRASSYRPSSRSS